jgi:hypothetical protein
MLCTSVRLNLITSDPCTLSYHKRVVTFPTYSVSSFGHAFFTREHHTRESVLARVMWSVSDETDPDGMPPLVWKQEIAHDEEAEVEEVYATKKVRQVHDY